MERVRDSRDAASSGDLEENHVTYGREPARWKLPKVRDYCFSRRRDARGRSVSKSVFAPSLLSCLSYARREKRVKRETEKGRQTDGGRQTREREREREGGRDDRDRERRAGTTVEEEDEEDDDDDDEEMMMKGERQKWRKTGEINRRLK